MPDTTAWVSLASGLGGALIGAAAGIYAPMRQHRHQTREEEKALRRARRDKRVSQLAELRVTGRRWLDLCLRTQQNFQAGVASDLDRFDEELDKTRWENAAVAYNLGDLRHEFGDDAREMSRLSAEIFDALDDLSLRMRKRILRGSGAPSELASFAREIERIRQLRAAFNVELLERLNSFIAPHV